MEQGETKQGEEKGPEERETKPPERPIEPPNITVLEGEQPSKPSSLQEKGSVLLTQK